jgi:hypothetical protein
MQLSAELEIVMQQTIEVIVHPDGTIEALQPITATQARRALLTILDDPVVASVMQPPAPATEAAQVDAALRAAGLLDTLDDAPAQLQALSEAARAALAASIPAGSSFTRARALLERHPLRTYDALLEDISSLLPR